MSRETVSSVASPKLHRPSHSLKLNYRRVIASFCTPMASLRFSTASTICLALKVWKIWSCNRQSYHSRICKRRCSRAWLRGGTVFLPTTCPWLSSKCAGAFRVVLPEWRQSTIRWHEVAVVHDTFTSSAVEIKSPCLPEASSSCKMFKCK